MHAVPSHADHRVYDAVPATEQREADPGACKDLLGKNRWTPSVGGAGALYASAVVVVDEEAVRLDLRRMRDQIMVLSRMAAAKSLGRQGLAMPKI